MKRIFLAIICTIVPVGLWAQGSGGAFPVFTGEMDVMETAPEWSEGTEKYFNFQPGGQSGGYVVVKKGGEAHIWDNINGKFVLEYQNGEVPDRISFLRNDCVYFHLKSGISAIAIAPGEDIENLEFYGEYEDLAMVKVDGWPDMLAAKEGGMWGILDSREPAYSLVAPRHRTLSEVKAALPRRSSEVKRAGETDLEYIVRCFRAINSTSIKTENTSYDDYWGWTAFTLKETPYSGHYYVDIESAADDREAGDSEMTLYSPAFTVCNDALALAYSEQTLETWAYGEGRIVPLSRTLLNAIKNDPVKAKDGSVLYADKVGFGYLFYPDGSFLSGYFQPRGSGSVPDYFYVGGPYVYMDVWDLYYEYCFSASSKGEDSPSYEEFASKLGERNLVYRDSYYWTVGDYDKSTQTVTIYFPDTDIQAVDLPLPMRNWNEFYSLATTYGRSDWDVRFEIAVDPEIPSFYVTSLEVSFPQRENMHFTYKAPKR
ncbi:MAG: hypothetical protein J6W74_05075 [Bacteroidales bacterium]|nr:hypothetical protein [Bacteroidales bacterium]